MNNLIIALSIMLLTGISAYATEAPTLDLGKTLFESSELGTTGRSCSSCHPDGKGLDMVGDFNDVELKDIINACFRDALKAEMISAESQEMDALVGYVRKFEKP